RSCATSARSPWGAWDRGPAAPCLPWSRPSTTARRRCGRWPRTRFAASPPAASEPPADGPWSGPLARRAELPAQLESEVGLAGGGEVERPLLADVVGPGHDHGEDVAHGLEPDRPGTVAQLGPQRLDEDPRDQVAQRLGPDVVEDLERHPM